MNPKKALCPAVLLASVLAFSPLAPAQAAPWRATGILPSVEKDDLLSWVRVLATFFERTWGKEGVSIDPNGSGGVTPSLPPVAPAPGDGPDHGMSIDPNGGN